MVITIGGSLRRKQKSMKDKPKVGFIGGKFLPFHNGHEYVITCAAKQVDELYVVLTSSEKRDKELCERDGIKYMSADLRLSWMGTALKNLKNVHIIHVKDRWGEEDYDWDEGARMIKQAIGKPIDCIFSSEKSYDLIFKKNYPRAEHIVIDPKRKAVNISATQIRKDLYRNWENLPKCVRPFFVKKVAIVGTESCGKTTLAEKLAKHYRTNRVHEVGRDYCERHNNQLTPEMFDRIGMEHFLLQTKRIEESNKVLFVDSDAIITQYYLDMYFEGRKSPLLEEIIKLQNYDLVIYLEPDVKWVEDGLRFAGEEKIRKKNNERLNGMYSERGIPFVSISGDYDERFNKARQLVNRLFGKD